VIVDLKVGKTGQSQRINNTLIKPINSRRSRLDPQPQPTTRPFH
jgi:hypothetical protein